MDQKTIEFLERSNQVFMLNGIKSVTMDDLAKELGVSKKTLYKHFEDKNQLVCAIVQTNIDVDKVTCLKIQSTAINAIDSLFEITKYVVDKFRNLHPSVFYDLKKYHPEAWQLLHDHKWQFIFDIFKQNIERGKKEKLYRNELNTEIVARLHVSSTDTILSGEVFPPNDFQYDQVFTKMMDLHLHGLVNTKGNTYLQERLNSQSYE